MLSGIGRRQHWDAGLHGAFGAVRPFRAILPTAKRRAPSAHEPRTATPLRRPRAVRLSVHQIVCSRMFMITDIGKNYYISRNL